MRMENGVYPEFVGIKYWYFGREALSPPQCFAELRGGRGIRVKHDPTLVTNFIEWVANLKVRIDIK